MMKRLSPALLLAAVACGPLPPAESSPTTEEPVRHEAPVEPAPVQANPGAPRAAVTGAGSISGAKIAHADVAMAELRKRMRGCYQQALTQHPTEAGSYAFTMVIDAQGGVASSEGKADGSISPETVACLSGVMNSTRFGAPDGSSSTVKGQFAFSSSSAATP